MLLLLIHSNYNNNNLYLYSAVYPEIQYVLMRLKHNIYNNNYYNEIHKSIVRQILSTMYAGAYYVMRGRSTEESCS